VISYSSSSIPLLQRCPRLSTLASFALRICGFHAYLLTSACAEATPASACSLSPRRGPVALGYFHAALRLRLFLQIRL